VDRHRLRNHRSVAEMDLAPQREDQASLVDFERELELGVDD
jgi:hypothetical protein